MSSNEAERAAQLARHVDFGIVTALPEEWVAVREMLDDPVPYVAAGGGSGCNYLLGEIPSYNGGAHTVAVSLAGIGNSVAATHGSILLRHFDHVEAVLMVGIAGGVPWPEKPEAHVRLGEVVVSEQVIQFDFIKKTRRGVEYRPPPRPAYARLLEAAKYLAAEELTGNWPWEKHIALASSIRNAARPAAASDVLASTKDPGKHVAHPPDSKRRDGAPRIFRGVIGSSGTLLKDARERDRLRSKFAILAVEMEASGVAEAAVAHNVGFISIRGISDYCDGNKNDVWHGYAAVAAAAYTRALLQRTASRVGNPNQIPVPSMMVLNSQAADADLDETKKLLDERQPGLARALLERIRRRQGYDLLPGRQFRLLSQLGYSYLMERDTDKAEQHFLEAKKLQPHDEKARVNEARVYEARGETARVHEIAAGIMVDFPKSGAALALWLRTAPHGESADEQEKYLIGTHERCEEARLAVAIRAGNCGDFSRAERLALTVIETNPTSVPARFVLAKIVYHSALSDLGADARELDDVAGARLQVSAKHLDEVIAYPEVQKDKFWRAECFLARANVSHALGESAHAERDFAEAARLFPDDAAVEGDYGRFLWAQERYQEAVGHLEIALKGNAHADVKFFLALCLRQRSARGDAAWATSLLVDVAKDKDCDFAVRALPMAVSGLIEQGQFPDARSLVSAACASEGSLLVKFILMGTISVAEGDVEAAYAHALAALKAWTAKAEVTLTRRLVDVFAKLNRYVDALTLCEHLFSVTRDPKDAHNVIACAYAAKRDDLILTTCRGMRESGQLLRDTAGHEVDLLQRYDLAEAVRVLEDLVRSYPDDRRAHLVLAMCRFRLGQQNSFSVPLDLLPLPEDLDPNAGVHVVQLLRESHRASDAVRYGYALVRHHYDHQEAHRAFCLAMLRTNEEKSDKEDLTPDSVQIGAAACYGVTGEATENWCVITDDANPMIGLDEYAPDHAWACELIGKKVGDHFNVPGTGVIPQIGVIKNVVSKYVFRYHDSMRRMAIDFGKETGWVMGHFDVDPELKPEEALRPLLAQLDAGHTQEVVTAELYRGHFMSIHQFAKMRSRSDYEGYQILLESELNVRCWTNDRAQEADVLSWIGEAGTVVVDLTAVFTLHMLEQIDLLSNPGMKFVVTQGTLEELRNAERLLRQGRRHRSGLARVGLGYHWVELAPELADRMHRQMVATLEMVMARCAVASGRDLAAVEAEDRDMLISFFGWHGAESLAIATANNYVLWTDDITLEVAGRAKLGLKRRVWTQAVLQSVLKAAEGRERLAICGAKLLGWGYSPVNFDLDIVLQAGELARWNTAAWPLRRAIESFGDESANFTTWLAIARNFICWVEAHVVVNPGAQDTYRRMLERLRARREPGVASAVDGMLRSLPSDARAGFEVSQQFGIDNSDPARFTSRGIRRRP